MSRILNVFSNRVYLQTYGHVVRAVSDMCMDLETLTETNNIIITQELDVFLFNRVIPSLEDVRHAIYNSVNDYIIDNLY